MRDERDEGTMTFEELEHRVEEQRKRTKSMFIQMFEIALDVLSGRMLVFLALLSSVGLFSWAMLDPQALRLLAAAAFTGMVFLPVLWKHKEMRDGR